MVDSVDDENAFYVHKERRAAKVHVCEECRRAIEPGERYHLGTWLYDGRWSTLRMCAQCWAAARWLDVVCSGWLWGAVRLDLDEHLGEYGRGRGPRSAHLTRLIRFSQRRWQHRDGTLATVDEVRGWTDAAIARVPAEMRGAP